MLSRVASGLYWLSRYVERSDGMLRMLKINYAASQDAVQEFSWRPVLQIFTHLSDGEIEQLEFNSRGVMQLIALDRENPNSILNIITLARENARGMQEHITKDLWQCLNEYYHVVKGHMLEDELKNEDPISVLDVLIKQVMLYYGTAEITMERSEGRAFMNIGKYLERAIQSLDILDSKFSSINSNPDLLTDTSYWKHLLQSLGGYELYLKTYRQGFEAMNVLEQVALNNDFPRSVIYSINNLQRYFERLKSDRNPESFSQLSFLIGRLQSQVRYSSIWTIQEVGIHPYLSAIKNDLYGIGNALNEYYFAYA
ncbi:MAG: alpha-E domain-containing protein [Mucilaginibacter polytrichastri]|nr:alpha-E domain-containing protein [Mucilaginibacter polytrichastri]